MVVSAGLGDRCAMSRARNNKSGEAKLLDTWSPPTSAGKPVGCVATSFTFEPAFFEEECLGRFLNLESHPVDDGALYLIEREEKLTSLVCATALVDQHHCRGIRSLRWDLLPVRMPRGIQHAKISILCWENVVRLIVASANLTQPGYRLNREIFTVLDYHDDCDAPLGCIVQIADFIRQTTKYCAADDTLPATVRCLDLLDTVVEKARNFRVIENPKGKRQITVEAILTGPDRSSALEQINNHLAARFIPRKVTITSPFFDPDEAKTKAAHTVWNSLAKRGAATVTYNVEARELPGEKRLELRAPEYLKESAPASRTSAHVEFTRITDDDNRPLHMKTMLFEADDWTSYLLGSGNFTSAGLGLHGSPNLEANLLYSIDRRGNEPAWKALTSALIPTERIKPKTELLWQAPLDTEDSPVVDFPMLSLFFDTALFRKSNKGEGVIRFTFSGETPDAAWKVKNHGDERVIYDSKAWKKSSSPECAEIIWRDSRPPSGFEVFIGDATSSAWWPVTIEDSLSLPPPDDLKNLPLDILVEILTSARPLHQVLRARLKVEKDKGDNVIPLGDELDPHRRVDTSNFMLQRTRRLSSAFAALRKRLEAPVVSRDGLRWRLKGPVGALALAGAIVRDAEKAQVSKDEAAFFLAELALELSRVKTSQSNVLSSDEFREELHGCIREIKTMAGKRRESREKAIARYIADVFREAFA